MPALWHFLSQKGLEVAVLRRGGFQSRVQGAEVDVRFRAQAEQRPAVRVFDVGAVEQGFELDQASGGGGGHAVVGEDDDVYDGGEIAGREACQEGGEHVVCVFDGGADLGRVWPVEVAVRVDIRDVESQELRAAFLGGQGRGRGGGQGVELGRPVEQGEHARDFAREGLGAVEPVDRLGFGRDAGLGAGPHVHRGAHALLLAGRPQRLRARRGPPLGLHAARRVRVVELLPQRRVPEGVAHHAVRLRVQPRDQGPVVGEGQAREAGQHVFGRHAGAHEGLERRRQAARQEVGTEAVERDEDRGGREVGGAVGAQDRRGFGRDGQRFPLVRGPVGTEQEEAEEDEEGKWQQQEVQQLSSAGLPVVSPVLISQIWLNVPILSADDMRTARWMTRSQHLRRCGLHPGSCRPPSRT